MNSVDQDRLESKLRGASVIDLDEYRARAATARATTSKPYVDPLRAAFMTWALVAAFVLFVVFTRR